MQNASKQYKESMRKPFRNRGYISARIGIVSSVATDNIIADSENNDFAYFSNITAPFRQESVSKIYATLEQDFAKVDGSMYFLPEDDPEVPLYNNGIVTENFLGSVHLTFSGNFADIKGLTIDFGDCYPTSLKITSDHHEKIYDNGSNIFVTEDAFDGISYLIITPLSMVNGQGRMRIYQFTCGISNTFSNDQVKKFEYKEFVSPICETLPSQDMTLVVDNQNLYYSPDNPESAVAYMEQGQEMKVSFGYDIDGYGTIEWLPAYTAYLKSWSATDMEVKFNLVDVLDWKLNETYYNGLYRAGGISLYDLAMDVFNDAGMSEDEYVIDEYLKNITVVNPIPAVKQSEALQIIANAGRCVLSVNRDGKIEIRSSFPPDMSAISDNETDFSKVQNVLDGSEKDAYAMGSNDFSITNGSIKFLPENESYVENTGYISESLADSEGNFTDPPKITIELETGFTCYGMMIKFRNVAPKEYVFKTYYQNEIVQDVTVTDPNIISSYTDQLYRFDKMEILFTKGYPNARITVDNIIFGKSTDYTLSRNFNIFGSVTAEKQNRIKAISVVKSIYKTSTDPIKELVSEDITIDSTEMEHIVYLPTPSYGFSVSIQEGSATASIIDSSNYFVKIKFASSTGAKIKYIVQGYEFSIEKQNYRKVHNETGEEKTWENPLISSTEMAMDQEEWLASYYLGDVDYQISWNGDPRTDANDLFFLELKNRENVTIRAYQNELTFDVAWKGNMKARKVVL